MKNKLLLIISIVAFFSTCFSCDNNVETSYMDEGTYSEAEKEEFKKLAAQYGSEVIFSDDKIDRKIPIAEFERMLVALKSLKAEYPLKYSILYSTPTGLMIPSSRVYQSKEHHPVSVFTVEVEEGEGFYCMGEVVVTFSTTGDINDSSRVSGNLSFNMLESFSEKGYWFSMRPDGGESVDPIKVKKGDGTTSISVRKNFILEARLANTLMIRKTKVFSTTVPTDQEGTSVNCTVRDYL